MKALTTRAMMVTATVLGLAMAGQAAQPAAAQSGGAVMISDSGSCFLLDGSGQPVSGGRSGGRIQVTTDGIRVGGVCTAQVAPPATGVPQVLTGGSTDRDCTLLVQGQLLTTRTWTLSITQSGEATLVCNA